MVRPLHLPSARRSLPTTNVLVAFFALAALMLFAPAGAAAADISFATFTADSSVAGGEMMNQAGGWFNALSRMFGSYGFLIVIIIGSIVSIWGFSIGNNKAIGISGIVAAALAALYKGLISFL